MSFRNCAIAGILTAGLLSNAANAQLTEPGPEHKKLKQMEGTWDAAVKSVGGESKASATYKMALNGLWLMEHFKGDIAGMPFEGYGSTSYDPKKKKYVGVWIDSMVPTALVMDGTYDEAKKTMTMVGDMPMPDGKKAKATMTTVATDADTRVFTIRTAGPDGGEREMLQITYTRRK